MKARTYTPARAILRQRIYNRMVSNRERIARLAVLLKCQPEHVEKKLDRLAERIASIQQRLASIGCGD